MCVAYIPQNYSIEFDENLRIVFRDVSEVWKVSSLNYVKNIPSTKSNP